MQITSLIKDIGMLRTPVSTSFLHVLDVESGLWVTTTLGSPVSPLTLEAMNLILFKDGILAYIGTRSEFGNFLSNLKRDRETDIRHCWISLPASTVMSILGLCLNLPMSGRPELVFYGSPLTVAVGYLLDLKSKGMLDNYDVSQVSDIIDIEGKPGFRVSDDIAFGIERYLLIHDLNEAMSYIKENTDV
jgi:hypothetical protein